jgi:acyl-CoA reductase-like NAD-dependent aldehyde dehydrogenase
LLGLLATICPVIVGGNTCIALPGRTAALPAIALAEVLATSDVPGGVVNILTGQGKEMLQHAASHRDINALIFAAGDADELQSDEVQTLQQLAAGNVKRIILTSNLSASTPDLIVQTQEIKTTWHPMGA